MTITAGALAPQTGQRWRDRANCIDTDPEAFFPPESGSPLAAKRICANCQVQAECLQYALRSQQRFGVWGGYSQHELRRLLRGQAVSASRNRGAHRPSSACWGRGCRRPDCRWIAQKAGLIP